SCPELLRPKQRALPSSKSTQVRSSPIDTPAMSLSKLSAGLALGTSSSPMFQNAPLPSCSAAPSPQQLRLLPSRSTTQVFVQPAARAAAGPPMDTGPSSSNER